jgi:Ca2+-binding RTX toxin-like protein
LDVLANADAADRNLLIGGLGADTLQGGPGEEILIGGTTRHDNNLAALAAVMREWRSDKPFDTRCANLDEGVPDLLARIVELTRKTKTYRKGTVLDDKVRDKLFGGAGNDWLFNFAKDAVRS